MNRREKIRATISIILYLYFHQEEKNKQTKNVTTLTQLADRIKIGYSNQSASGGGYEAHPFSNSLYSYSIFSDASDVMFERR